MAKSRRTQRRERRTYRNWLRQEQLRKLRRIEEEILDPRKKPGTKAAPGVGLAEWWVEGKPVRDVVGVDFGSSDGTCVMVATYKDGICTLTLRRVGTYSVVMKVNQ